MANAESLKEKDVRALQSMVLAEAPRPRRAKRTLSRAAALELIDRLSRESVGGLATLAGATVFLAGLFGAAAPLRAGLWVTLVLSALIVCRFLQHRYRSGAGASATPFSWRRDYNAAVTVLSTAFGAGAIFMVQGANPTGAAAAPLADWAHVIIGVVFGGLIIAAAFHRAHVTSVASLLAPGGALAIYSLARHGFLEGAGLLLLGGFVIAALAIVASASSIRTAVSGRLPRTTLFRQDPDQERLDQGQYGSEVRASASGAEDRARHAATG